MIYSESQALAKIAAYCSKAERAEYDVRQKLSRWELTEPIIYNIINRLKKENFLNEERFCNSFIKDKMRFNKWGKTKIIYELKRKSIPETIISNCFEGIEVTGFEESLLKILITKNKSVKAETDFERRNKLIRFALGRGFSYEEINKCLKQILGNNAEEYPE